MFSRTAIMLGSVAALMGVGGMKISAASPTPAPQPRPRRKKGKTKMAVTGRNNRSKYMPHQGGKECARRIRQMAKARGEDG